VLAIPTFNHIHKEDLDVNKKSGSIALSRMNKLKEREKSKGKAKKEASKFDKIRTYRSIAECEIRNREEIKY